MTKKWDLFNPNQENNWPDQFPGWAVEALEQGVWHLGNTPLEKQWQGQQRPVLWWQRESAQSIMHYLQLSITQDIRARKSLTSTRASNEGTALSNIGCKIRSGSIRLNDLRQLWMLLTVVESCENMARSAGVRRHFTSSRLIALVSRRFCTDSRNQVRWIMDVYEQTFGVLQSGCSSSCHRLLRSYARYLINALIFDQASLSADDFEHSRQL